MTSFLVKLHDFLFYHSRWKKMRELQELQDEVDPDCDYYRPVMVNPEMVKVEAENFTAYIESLIDKVKDEWNGTLRFYFEDGTLLKELHTDDIKPKEKIAKELDDKRWLEFDDTTAGERLSWSFEVVMEDLEPPEPVDPYFLELPVIKVDEPTGVLMTFTEEDKS